MIVLHRQMLGRPWTSSGRGDRGGVTWWGPSSISITKNGSGGVRPTGADSETRPQRRCMHDPSDGNWTILSLFSDSGVGAGIDSYYEYLMKAYILLGDDVFLDRFNVVSPPSPRTEKVCFQAFGLCSAVLTAADVSFTLFVCTSTTAPS